MVQFTLEFGGGTGWFKNGEDNVRDAERGIWNTMKAMRMIDGEFEADGPLCTVYNAGVVLWKPPVDGFFIRLKEFGEFVKAGEVYGMLVDPYTGEGAGDDSQYQGRDRHSQRPELVHHRRNLGWHSGHRGSRGGSADG